MASISPDERREYENLFRRQMVYELSPLETKVMIYILDRTLGWMKDRERISYREFLDGKANNRGVNVHATSAVRAIKSLKELGVIEILSSTRRRGTIIRVNLDWTPQHSQCTHEV